MAVKRIHRQLAIEELECRAAPSAMLSNITLLDEIDTGVYIERSFVSADELANQAIDEMLA